jgi:hypothetical protein
MHTLASIAVSTAALAILTLDGGPASASPASASPGSPGTWPTAYPLPTNPGTVTSQTDATAVVRSTDAAWDVERRLDQLYVTQLGCTRRLAMNRPRDYLCYNPTTGKIDEIVFTFAALDPTATNPTRSQTNAYHVKG